MAAMVAMNAMMTRIGFEAATRDEIYLQGLGSLDAIGSYDAEFVQRTCSNISKRCSNRPEVNVKAVAIMNLLACNYWVQEQQRLGIDPTCNAFSTDRMKRVHEQMLGESRLVDLMKGITPIRPPPLMNLDNWPTFWNIFVTWATQTRGASRCPIRYVFRDHELVTPAMLLEVYDTDDERLIMTLLLSGIDFRVDNTMLFDELKVLLINGPGWTFIMRFDRSRDGRAAIRAIRNQCEGDATNHLRKQRAYAAIASAVYNGEKKSYPFIKYVATHQDAHHELELLGEPVPETKKVMDLLAGTRAAEMASATAIIIGDAEKKNSFIKAQTYLANFVGTNSTLTKISNRNVSFADSGEDGRQKRGGGGRYTKSRGGGGGGGGKGGGKNGGGKLTARSYSRPEWNALTADEKSQVMKLREDDKKQKRSVKAANRARDESSDEDEAPPKDAGNQFGRKGHKKRKE
jgi:uncharacterized membrane protein YgcG